ncbi:unnamed protein product [Meganyctiphanes norvegica]|uniref:Uncharacterized protein n=1 Tax=Meganyctiphanes norvegica TaxID=48144 RepID=A0AAV2PLH3_MEGNR
MLAQQQGPGTDPCVRPEGQQQQPSPPPEQLPPVPPLHHQQQAPGSSSSSPPRAPPPHPHLQQFCDACNTACVFMNGRRRKFQARYEGYVLLKRVSGPPGSGGGALRGGCLAPAAQPKPFLPSYVMATTAAAEAGPCNNSTVTAAHHQHLPKTQMQPSYRRHSCGDELDADDENHDPTPSQHSPDATTMPLPPTLITPPQEPPGMHLPYSRSYSHPEWQQQEDPPLRQLKTVNLDDARGGALQHQWAPPNGNMTSPLPDSPTDPSTPSANTLVPPRSPTPGGTTDGGGSGGRKPRRHSAMMERLACGHQRLCRKKSRSSDNLSSSGGGGGSRRSGPRGTSPLRLNNSIVPPPAPLSHSLSRSEGSIHNVHGILSAATCDEGGTGGYGGGLRAEVGELARLPKRLLHRMTGEVSQLVFDLEGWREEYLVLTPTAIAIRTVSHLL